MSRFAKFNAAFSLAPPPPARTRTRNFSPAQQQCDDIQAEARATPLQRVLATPPPVAPLKPSDDVLLCRLAEELGYARRLLGTMGERLASDPTILARHSGTMQGFDAVEQMLGHIGGVIGAADRREAVTRIGMADLRGRLERRSIIEEDFVPSGS